MTRAATSARVPKYRSRSGAPARRASLTRNTADRYALVATNSAPITSESGLSQLVTASPVALPTGTRPPAIAPTTVPMKNGVSSDASPNERDRPPPGPPARRAVWWNAKPGAAQHDPERGQAERDEQRREDRLERGREAGPEHDEHEDQPDVVGLPHGSDRPVDQLARAPAALASAGEQAPEARPRSPRRRTRRTSSRRSRARSRRRRRCSSRALRERGRRRAGVRAVRARRRPRRRPRASAAPSPAA